MKTRNSFVANSSASSFLLDLKDVSRNQLAKIYDIKNIAKRLELENLECIESWKITKIGGKALLRFYTSMDNFNMVEFLEKIGITKNKLKEFWRS